MSTDHRYPPHFGTGRADRRLAYLDAWRVIGCLYGLDGGAEEHAIRAACEDLGVPMGYGRVGRVPAQLADEYAVPVPRVR